VSLKRQLGIPAMYTKATNEVMDTELWPCDYYICSAEVPPCNSRKHSDDVIIIKVHTMCSLV